MSKKIYGSVDGLSNEVAKIYGSVSGLSKNIIKGYCPVNGLSKLFFDTIVSLKKTQVQFLEDYKNDGSTYDLQYASIEQTIRYYIEELNFLNINNKTYAQSVGGQIGTFFNSLNVLNNNIDNIVNYVLSKITNENEIYITGRLNSSTIEITFALCSSSFTGKQVTGIKYSDTKTGFIYLSAFPVVSRSTKGIKLSLPQSGQIGYGEVTGSMSEIQIGQNVSVHGSTPPQYPLFPIIGNVGIRFVTANVPDCHAYWDFTNSMADVVDKQYWTTSSSAPTRDSSGLHIAGNNQFLYICRSLMETPVTYNGVITKGILEIEVGDMNLQNATSRNCALISRWEDTNRVESLLYNYTEQIWGIYTIYNPSYSATFVPISGATDKDYFKNSVVKWVMDDTYIYIYKDNSLLANTERRIKLSSLYGNFFIGGYSNNSVNNTVIKNAKFYKEETPT